mmetsp:Transcript_1009/g.6356  ORF Transcript_1009/g.6356 Transcript_1009/m.6356 type:complete len:134 (+) Transcript_1009:363-764(+)
MEGTGFAMPPNQEAEGGPVGDLPKIGRRCFVGNLAWSTSWQDLKDHFRDAGTVVYCNVTREPSGESTRSEPMRSWTLATQHERKTNRPGRPRSMRTRRPLQRLGNRRVRETRRGTPRLRTNPRATSMDCLGWS